MKSIQKICEDYVTNLLKENNIFIGDKFTSFYNQSNAFDNRYLIGFKVLRNNPTKPENIFLFFSDVFVEVEDFSKLKQNKNTFKTNIHWNSFLYHLNRAKI